MDIPTPAVCPRCGKPYSVDGDSSYKTTYECCICTGEELLNLVTDNKLREKLKHDGFKRAIEKFDAKSMANNHLDCYKHLTEEKRLTGQ